MRLGVDERLGDDERLVVIPGDMLSRRWSSAILPPRSTTVAPGAARTHWAHARTLVTGYTDPRAENFRAGIERRRA